MAHDIRWMNTLTEARDAATATRRLVLVMGLLNGCGADDGW
jgi:hypothetical protein